MKKFFSSHLAVGLLLTIVTLSAPRIAALISKRPDGYIITAVKEGYPKLNNRSISGQTGLKAGIYELFLFQFQI